MRTSSGSLHAGCNAFKAVLMLETALRAVSSSDRPAERAADIASALAVRSRAHQAVYVMDDLKACMEITKGKAAMPDVVLHDLKGKRDERIAMP